jgi:hypothetical protein
MQHRIDDKWLGKFVLALVVLYCAFRVVFFVGDLQPWYDEAFYSDVAIDHISNGTYHVPLDFPRTAETVTIWNTLGFSHLQGAIFRLLGISIVSLRLSSLLFGLFVFGAFLFHLFKHTRSWLACLIFCLFFMTDKTLNPYLFAGRPDVMSFFLVTCSVLLFEKAQKVPPSLSRYSLVLLSSLLLALGCVVTLRTLIAVIPFACLLGVYRTSDGRRATSAVLAWGAVSCVIVVLYFLVSLGGSEAMWAVMRAQGDASSTSQHFGFDFYRNVLRTYYNAPKLILFYASSLYLLYRYGEKLHGNFFLYANLMIALGFFLFIKEAGQGSSNPYSILILPSVYYVFAVLHFYLPERVRAGYSGLLLLILATNVVTFLPRLTFTLLNPSVVLLEKQINQCIEAHVPPRELVFAEQRFYFNLLKNGNGIVGVPKIPNAMMHPDRTKTILVEKKPAYYIGLPPDRDARSLADFELIAWCPNIPNRGGTWLTSRYGRKNYGIYKIDIAAHSSRP